MKFQDNKCCKGKQFFIETLPREALSTTRTKGAFTLGVRDSCVESPNTMLVI